MSQPPAFSAPVPPAADTLAETSGRLDGAGVAISALCLLHCIALPLVAAMLPAAEAWLDPVDNTRVHWLLLALALPISLVALIRGARLLQTRRWTALGVTGLSLMLVAVLHVFGTASEHPITMVGVTVLATAHIGNWTSLHRRRGDA